MAASPSVDDSFTFVGGLFTEGSFFLTPKNCWVEGDNVVPNTDGSVVRRQGLDYEDNYQVDTSIATTETSLNNDAFCIETWSSVGGNGNLDFFVVQRGPIIQFYKAFSGVVSANKLSATINLNDYKCFGNTNVVGTNVITTASCYGRLLITSIDTVPILVTYEPSTEVITHQRLDLRIRDFEGIRSPLPETAELSLTEWETNYQFATEAVYNLYNQGWTQDKIDAYVVANANGHAPSNTKQWWYGKDSNDDFSPAALNKNDFGSSYAPRGRFVLQAFYQDRAAVAGFTSEVPLLPNINETLPIPPYFESGGDSSGDGGPG